MNKKKFEKWELQLHRVHFANWAVAMTKQDFGALIDIAVEEGINIGDPATAKRRNNCNGCVMRILRIIATEYYKEQEEKIKDTEQEKTKRRVVKKNDKEINQDDI